MRHSAPELALLGELRGLLTEVDPVPERVYGAAYAARHPASGERLNSDVDSSAGMRGEDDRVLRFTGEELSVRLMLCRLDSGSLRILGVLSPAVHEKVTAHWPEGAMTSTVEEHGRFLVSPVPRGPLRLDFDGRARTEWFLG